MSESRWNEFEVGQRWSPDGDSDPSPWVILAVDAKGVRVSAAPVVGDGIRFERASVFDCALVRAWRRVSSPEPRAEAAAGVDWSLWLPPLPLPRTGPKEFEAGQVWTFSDVREDRRVYRATVSGPFESLAGAPVVLRVRAASVVADHAILVQEVGQPAPTPPAELWRRAYGVCGADMRGFGDCTAYKGHAVPLPGGGNHVSTPEGREYVAAMPATPKYPATPPPAPVVVWPATRTPTATPPPPVTCKATGCSVTVGLSARQWCVVHHEHDELEARAAAYGNVTIDVRKPLPPLVFEPYEPTWGSRGGLGSWRRR